MWRQGYWIIALKSPHTGRKSTQSLNGFEAVILVEIDLKGAANTGMQNKRAQYRGGETNVAAIKALCKNRFCTALI